jgi:hypothetical protein
MKRQSGKRDKKRKMVEGECTIPPPPVKHILSSFTLSNPLSKRAISDYVESQARGEKVQHAEKVKSEHLFDRNYDCWDVHNQRDRYWVVTSPTNLYSQKYFPSLDFTLSFHVGVMARSGSSAGRSRCSPRTAFAARVAQMGAGRRIVRHVGGSGGFSGRRREMQGNLDSACAVAFQAGNGAERNRSAQAG